MKTSSNAAYVDKGILKEGIVFMILIGSLIILTIGCSDDHCEAFLDDQCACPAIYDPVCGCNDVTYGNSCEALCNDITDFTFGECP